MLMFKCFTCRTLFANKQLIYEQKLESVCMNNDLSEEEKNQVKSKILDELEIKRYCCRPRIMGYMKHIEVVK